MDLKLLGGTVFKFVAIGIAIFYLLYSLVLSKQVRVMGKVVDIKTNSILYVISSIQITVAFILLIFSIFLI